MNRTIDQDDEEKLTIRIKSQDGEKKTYSIGNYHTSIMKLLQNHYRRKDLQYKTVRFLIDGARFDHKKTPTELELKDGTSIDAFVSINGVARLIFLIKCDKQLSVEPKY